MSGKLTNPISREALADGSMLRQFTALAGAHTVLSEAERASRFEALLASIPSGSDLWLFAYGSMLWNPTVHFAQARRVTVKGWHRSFCLRSAAGRGSPERPGLMLGIEPGGECQGLAYRLPVATIRSELHLLWQREMVTGAYRAEWVKGQCDQAGEVDRVSEVDQAGEVDQRGEIDLVAFVIDPRSQAYEGRVDEAQQVRRICQASGMLGSNRDYLMMTRSQLRSHGICDDYIERLALAAEQISEQNSANLPTSAP